MSLYTEFDHYNLPMGADGTPYSYLEALRDEAEQTNTPIGWSEAHGGFWVCTDWDVDREIMMNPRDFSNEGCIFPRYGTGDAKLMLAMQDEPDHKKYRKLVQGPFTAAKVHEFEAPLRSSAIDLIDRFIDAGEVDLVQGLTDDVPARLTAIILGLPPEDGDRYRTWTHAMASLSQTDPEAAAKVIGDMNEYFDTMLEERRHNFGDDILSMVMQSETDGEALTYQEIKDFWVVLLIGGIDNTSKLLGTTVWRLAWDKELRRRLVTNPGLIPFAVNEATRYYTPGLVGRQIVNPIEVGGVRMEPGQHVILAHNVANRDSRVFTNPDAFIPERDNAKKHLGLGLGIHKCLGVHLVVLEMRIVIEELLRRLPEFELAPGKAPRWHHGQVSGMGEVPIVFPPGGGYKPREADGAVPVAAA